MKLSARNQIKGTVKKFIPGLVNSEVTLEIAPGVEIVSIITKTSGENLHLSPGKEAYIVIKATDVLLGVD